MTDSAEDEKLGQPFRDARGRLRGGNPGNAGGRAGRSGRPPRCWQAHEVKKIARRLRVRLRELEAIERARKTRGNHPLVTEGLAEAAKALQRRGTDL